MHIGEVIADRFHLRSLAGSGGMGRVYLATDSQTGNDVAVKVLSLDASKYSRRFIREAKVMAGLSHPNIVAYVDYGETRKGAPFIVMEWVQGEDLRERMNRKALELPEALQIISGVGGALDFAHKRGVIHRDLKPSNLMLAGGDIEQLKLLDFGIARWRGPTVEKMTRTGISIGTPGYMAPEQTRGEAEIDGRADLYALGCVIYECLVGRRPYQGQDLVALAARGALDEPLLVSDHRSDISAEFDELLADMMAQRVERRPADGSVMATRAKAIPSQKATIAVPPRQLSFAEKHLLGLILVASPDVEQMQIAPDFQLYIARFGADTTLLDEGTLAIRLHEESLSAGDLVNRTARLALHLKALVPAARLVLATVQAQIKGRAFQKDIQATLEILRNDAASDNTPVPIRIDTLTHRLLDKHFEIRTSGQGDSLEVRLCGESNTIAAATPENSCVGRDSEIAAIWQNFTEAIAQQKARAMVIVGDPGTGKSRVCDEGILHIRNLHPDTQLWHARAVPKDVDISDSDYGLIKQIAQQLAGITERDSLTIRRKKLVRIVSDEGLPLQVAEFLGESCDTPFLATTSRTELREARNNAGRMTEQIVEAWTQLLTAQTSRNPVLYIVDGLHWTDVNSIVLLGQLLRNVESGWMILATARPEIDTILPGLVPTIWEANQVHRQRLEGLSNRACRALIRTTLGHDVDKNTLSHLIRLSRGNVFILDELIYSLRSLGNTSVPDTVLAFSQFRLRYLGAEQRRVLRAASIFGRRFTCAQVSELLPSVTEVRERIAKLIASDVIERIDDTYYRFCHELTREAAYSTLSDSDKEIGHRLAGYLLEEQHRTQSPVNTSNQTSVNPRIPTKVLANHFKLGKEIGKAAHWYRVTAQQAEDDGDMPTAIQEAEQGFAVGAAGRTLGLLHAICARALLWTGDNGNASEHCLLAMEYLETDCEDWAIAAGNAVTALGRCGAYDDIEILADTLIREQGDEPMSGQILSALARSASNLFFAGRFQVASDFVKVLPDSDSIVNCDPVVAGHLDSAHAHHSLCEGELGKYLTLSQRANAAFDSCGNTLAAVEIRIHVGFAYCQLGNYSQAETILRETLDIAIGSALDALIALAQHNLGLSLYAQGKLDEAWELELVAIELFSMQGDERMADIAKVTLSKIHQDKGLLESAEKVAREALAGTSTAPTVRMQAYAQLAAVLLAAGSIDEALDCATRANTILDALERVDKAESTVRLVFVKAQLANGQVNYAKDSLRIAHSSLLRRANLITNKTWRLSFVEEVSENAQILDLVTKWLI